MSTKLKSETNSESENEDVKEDIWDDHVLINAYEKAVEITNVDIAKRVAMATNERLNRDKIIENGQAESKNTKSSKSKSQKKASHHKKWKVGMPCRAIYDEDGNEYEAYINRITGDECVITYFGYDEADVVCVSDLKPSLGRRAQINQIKSSFEEKVDDGFSSQAETVALSCENEPCKKKNKQPKKKNHKSHSKTFQIPNGFSMPNINIPMFPGLQPPAPPPLLPRGVDSERQALSSMLLSWYMSGYYTGLYQATKTRNKK